VPDGTSTNVRTGGGSDPGSRDRDGRPVTGSATARDYSQGGGNVIISFPVYGPWGNYYPWYGSGFGWNLGFVYYDPWLYPGTSWGWGRYGLWYDPYGYYPYYDPFYSGGYGGGGSGYYEPKAPKDRNMVGSIRIKVNPGSAKVYVDGALYGTATEFDGLSNHLELDGGKHMLELRADGYQTLTKEITVEAGKTLTERASLKKKK